MATVETDRKARVAALISHGVTREEALDIAADEAGDPVVGDIVAIDANGEEHPRTYA